MSTIHSILDAARDTHNLPLLRIIETGCDDTVAITEWVSKNANAVFDTADLNGLAQDKVHTELQELNISKFYTLHTQDHEKFLSGLSWVDVAFLSPADLMGGLKEFNLAASSGARLIIVRDYQTKAALAVKQAKNFGWNVSYAEKYCVFIHPGRK